MSDGLHDFDPFERSLLASAKTDAMSPARKRALAAAFAGGATIATTTTAAAGAAGAAKAKAGIGLVIAKWVGAGVLGSAVVAGGINVASQRRHDTETQATAAHATHAQTPPPTPKALGTSPLPGETRPPEAAVVDDPAISTSEPGPPAAAPEAARAPAPAAATRSSARAHVPAPNPTLADELRLIERARACVAANDTACAARSLEAHARSFPAGVLVEEARVLRIDVMAGRGDRAGAEAAARAMVAAHPDSPHAPRLRALLGESSKP